MLYIRETGRPLKTRFGEHPRAICANDASQPVTIQFNSGSHVISDMKIRALRHFSGSNDMKCVLFTNLKPYTLFGINERFSNI